MKTLNLARTRPGYSTVISTKSGNSIDTSKFDKDAKIITECKRIDQTDLVILIDGSWSVTPDNFVRVQSFLSSGSENLLIF